MLGGREIIKNILGIENCVASLYNAILNDYLEKSSYSVSMSCSSISDGKKRYFVYDIIYGSSGSTAKKPLENTLIPFSRARLPNQINDTKLFVAR